MGAKGTRVGDGFQLARPWRSLGWRGRLRDPGARGAMRRGPRPLRSLPRHPHPPPPPTSFRSLRVWGLAGGGGGKASRQKGADSLLGMRMKVS